MKTLTEQELAERDAERYRAVNEYRKKLAQKWESAQRDGLEKIIQIFNDSTESHDA